MESSKKYFPVWLKRTITITILVILTLLAFYGFASCTENGEIFHDSFKIREIISDPKDSNIVYLQVTNSTGIPVTLIGINNCRGIAYQSDPGLIEQLKTLEIGQYYQISVYQDHFHSYPNQYHSDRLIILYVRPLN